MLVGRELCQCLGVTDTTSAVTVFPGDQFTDAALAVADDTRRNSLGASDDLAVDDEYPVVPPLAVLLDNDPVREFPRVFPGLAQRRLILDARRDAATVTGIEGLEYHRVADLLHDFQSAIYGSRDITFRHGQADIAQHSLGVVLILGDLDGYGAGVVGESGLDAPQILA